MLDETLYLLDGRTVLTAEQADIIRKAGHGHRLVRISVETERRNTLERTTWAEIREKSDVI